MSKIGKHWRTGLGTALATGLELLTAGAAQAQTCPPAGARYLSDNYVSREVVTALGKPPPPSLGFCYWRRDRDGEEIMLGMGSLTPLGPAPRARPAPAPAASAAGGPLPVGVYECDAPGGVAGSIMGIPTTGFFFGHLGGGNYRDFDGGRGTVAVSGDLVTMTSGPLNGIRYRRQAATLLRPLNGQGQIGSIRCVLNKAKSLTGRW